MEHVQAYLEYRAVVGDTDGGSLLTQEEYDKVRSEAAKAQTNSLHIYWKNSRTGNICEELGPSSLCFCQHRFRDHNYRTAKNERPECLIKGCRCLCFDYVPVKGSRDLKCSQCKQSFREHDPASRRCSAVGGRNRRGAATSNSLGRPTNTATAGLGNECISKRNSRTGITNAGDCVRFNSSWPCHCGDAFSGHETLIQTRRQREEAGLPCNPLSQGTIAPVGGLTGLASIFHSLDGPPATEREKSDLSPIAQTSTFRASGPGDSGNTADVGPGCPAGELSSRIAQLLVSPHPFG